MGSVASVFKAIESARSKKGRVLLFLDFDGTLAPIAPRPSRARMPEKTRKLLRTLSASMDIAIISGRALSDVRKRVGIAGIGYAGNHGLDWQFDSTKGSAKLPPHFARSLAASKKPIAELAWRFPGTEVEDKGAGLALHFRRMSSARVPALQRQLLALLEPLSKSDLRITRAKKVFEIRPDIDWSKADVVRLIIKHFKKRSGARTVIYIGDDETDEDAFRALPRDITICVGSGVKSAARFSLRDPAAVRALLSKMAGRDSR